MATPKGMRAVQLPVNATDVIHVYSDEQHIWLQLRRAVPTEQDIGRPSFKIAFCLTPGAADKLGLELLNIAKRNKATHKAKSAVRASKTSKHSTTQIKSLPKQQATQTTQK